MGIPLLAICSGEKRMAFNGAAIGDTGDIDLGSHISNRVGNRIRAL
jgi:hypothetical protein